MDKQGWARTNGSEPFVTLHIEKPDHEGTWYKVPGRIRFSVSIVPVRAVAYPNGKHFISRECGSEFRLTVPRDPLGMGEIINVDLGARTARISTAPGYTPQAQFGAYTIPHPVFDNPLQEALWLLAAILPHLPSGYEHDLARVLSEDLLAGTMASKRDRQLLTTTAVEITGCTKAHAQKRLYLLTLDPAVRQHIRHGIITGSVMDDLRKLSRDQQCRFLQRALQMDPKARKIKTLKGIVRLLQDDGAAVDLPSETPAALWDNPRDTIGHIITLATELEQADTDTDLHWLAIKAENGHQAAPGRAQGGDPAPVKVKNRKTSPARKQAPRIAKNTRKKATIWDWFKVAIDHVRIGAQAVRKLSVFRA